MTFQCLAGRHLCVGDLWSDGQEKYICMKLGAWSCMGAFFSIQIGCGAEKFGSQTPWSKNWCLDQELVFHSYTKTWELLCNFHISLQFSYQFAIFISVCNCHILVYSSYMDICNCHMSLQFSYQYAIFISVCNSHVTTPALIVLTWLCMDQLLCHYELELINSTSAMVLCGR